MAFTEIEIEKCREYRLILWLEDSLQTVRTEVAKAKNAGIEFDIRPNIGSFDKVLLEHSGIDPFPVKGLVIDIMLYTVMNLREIGVPNARTMNGTNTGCVLADRYLRAAKPKFDFWRDIPICFLTEAQIDNTLLAQIDRIRNKGGGPVHVLEKLKDEDSDKFVKLLQSWVDAP